MSKANDLAEEFRKTLNSGIEVTEEMANDMSSKVFAVADLRNAGLSPKEIAWLCEERLGEVIQFLSGQRKAVELKESCIQDMEGRYPKNYLEEGRWGLG